MQGYGYGGYGGFQPQPYYPSAQQTYPGYGSGMLPYQGYPSPFPFDAQPTQSAPQPSQPAPVPSQQQTPAPATQQSKLASVPVQPLEAAKPIAAPVEASIKPGTAANITTADTNGVRFLSVIINSGDNIPKMDLLSESDPYVTVQVGTKKFKSATIEDSGPNPNWREEFLFPLEAGQKQLTVELYDEDVTTSEFIGSFTVADFEAEIAKNKGAPVFYDLTLAKGVNSRNGQKSRLNVALSIIQSVAVSGIFEGATSSSKTDVEPGILTLLLVNAENVNNLVKGPKQPALADPYVVSSIGHRSFRSYTCNKTAQPVWKEKMRFLIDGSVIDGALRFSVYDNDVITGDVCIGVCEMSVSNLLSQIKAGSVEEVPFTTDIRTKAGSPFPNEKNGNLIFKASFEKSEKQLKAFYQHWFKLLDKNNDGHLDASEFKKFIPAISSKKMSEQELTQLFSDIDKDKNNVLDQNEVLNHFVYKLGYDFLDKEIFITWMANKDRENQVLTAKGSYTTEDEAIRGFFRNTSDWLDSAGYSTGLNVGNNSKHILVWNRMKRIIEKETINPALNLGMRVLYQGVSGATLRAIAKQTGAFLKMSEMEGKEYDKPESVHKIPSFVESFALNMEEALVPMDKYKSFNDFFARKLKPNARPIASPLDPKVVTQPADSRLVVFTTINEATTLWVKGKNFTVEALLGSQKLAQRFKNGSLSVHRLAPQDYHRFHSPVDGTILGTRQLPGDLWTVNPVAVNCVDVFTENKRHVTYIKSELYGLVAYINVGAHMVGTICYTGLNNGPDTTAPVKGAQVKKGQDLGYFKFGGSTVICVWEEGRIAFDEDLVKKSLESTETLVRMGETLGRAGAKAGIKSALPDPVNVELPDNAAAPASASTPPQAQQKSCCSCS